MEYRKRIVYILEKKGELKEEGLGLKDERDVIFYSDHQTEEAAQPQFVETFEEEDLGFDFGDEQELNFIYEEAVPSQLGEFFFFLKQKLGEVVSFYGLSRLLVENDVSFDFDNQIVMSSVKMTCKLFVWKSLTMEQPNKYCDFTVWTRV